ERQVFELYVKGKTSQEVALLLSLSINTIRTHNRNIYSKLNVSSYKELMVYIRMMTSQEKSSIS
ncbi:MAG: helix-turn-helix transcriptional regulator, partial [Mailhella sp.]